MELKKLLVVGGTGYIGRTLIARAISFYEITSVSLNLPEKPIPGVNYVLADLANKESLSKNLVEKNFDFVVNCGGYVFHKNFSEGGEGVLATHLMGTINLLGILNKESLVKYIQIGSGDEYGNNPSPQKEIMIDDPFSCYSLSKSLVTQLLKTLFKTDCIPFTVVRLFLVYGPGQNLNRLIPQVIMGCLKNEKFPTSEGKQIRDFCYIDDLIDGLLLVLESPNTTGEVINLASGIPVSVKELIENIRLKVGGGMPHYGVFPYKKNENMSLVADISKAKTLLNWSPKYDLEKGLERTIEYYRNIL